MGSGDEGIGIYKPYPPSHVGKEVVEETVKDSQISEEICLYIHKEPGEKIREGYKHQDLNQ